MQFGLPNLLYPVVLILHLHNGVFSVPPSAPALCVVFIFDLHNCAFSVQPGALVLLVSDLRTRDCLRC